MDLATARALTSPEGLAALGSLGPYEESSALASTARLRADGLPAELAAAVLQQSRLRARATAKIGPTLAARVLLTEDGLEQATRPQVAARHAERYASWAEAGVSRVHDLGCGLGFDAAGLALAGMRVCAVDADPVTALLAGHNLRVLASQAGAQVSCSTAETALTTVPARDALWFDPARRESGPRRADGRARRVFSLDRISPSWQTVLEAARLHAATGAKLSPGLPHAAVPAGAEAQWTSWGGEVVEAAVWFGPLARCPGRTAAVLDSDGSGVIAHLVTQDDAADDPGSLAAPAGLGPWLHDPDRAVVRAGLVGALAVAVGGQEVGPGSGYVTTAQERRVPWARRYAVREALPWQPKSVRAWLRTQGVERVTLKNRGSGLDPALVRRELKVRDGGDATLVLTRVSGRPYVLAVDAAP